MRLVVNKTERKIETKMRIIEGSKKIEKRKKRGIEEEENVMEITFETTRFINILV